MYWQCLDKLGTEEWVETGHYPPHVVSSTIYSRVGRYVLFASWQCAGNTDDTKERPKLHILLIVHEMQQPTLLFSGRPIQLLEKSLLTITN